jgi:hypothetical protein
MYTIIIDGWVKHGPLSQHFPKFLSQFSDKISSRKNICNKMNVSSAHYIGHSSTDHAHFW